MAMTYQLVTPVSGAVVLETEAQYAQARLRPIDAATAPAVVPEPGTLSLATTVFTLAFGIRRLRRRALLLVIFNVVVVFPR